MVDEEASSGPWAIRLTFRYDGDQVDLLSMGRIRKALPHDDSSTSSQDQIGTWTEVRDAAGRTLDQRVVHDPVRVDAEIFPEGLHEPITRIPLDPPAGLFTVLVPELPGADHLSLIRRTASARRERIESTEVLRVSLTAPPEEAGS